MPLLPPKQSRLIPRQIGTGIELLKPKQIDALAPVLTSIANLSQITGSNVTGDTFQFAADVPGVDDDGIVTTGVELLESGSTVAEMAEGPPKTWNTYLSFVVDGTKNYSVRRLFNGGQTESTVTPVTVLTDLSPDLLSPPPTAWWRMDTSISWAPQPLHVAGTGTNVVTLSGTLAGQTGDFYLTFPVSGPRGTATYSVSMQGPGGPVFQTGTTGAAPVPLGATGVFINFPATSDYQATDAYRSVCTPLVDKTGNGHNPSNATSGQRPLIVAPQQGVAGQPAVNWNGTSTVLNDTGTLANSVFGGLNTAWTLFVFLDLLALPSTGIAMNLFCAGNTVTASRVEIQILSNGFIARRHDDSGNDVSVRSVVLSSKGRFMFGARFDGTNLILQVNGADAIGGTASQEAPGLLSTPAALTLNNFSLGAQRSGATTTSRLNGNIYDMSIFNYAMTELQMLRATRYFISGAAI